MKECDWGSIQEDQMEFLDAAIVCGRRSSDLRPLCRQLEVGFSNDAWFLLSTNESKGFEEGACGVERFDAEGLSFHLHQFRGCC